MFKRMAVVPRGCPHHVVYFDHLCYISAILGNYAGRTVNVSPPSKIATDLRLGSVPRKNQHSQSRKNCGVQARTRARSVQPPARTARRMPVSTKVTTCATLLRRDLGGTSRRRMLVQDDSYPLKNSECGGLAEDTVTATRLCNRSVRNESGEGRGALDVGFPERCTSHHAVNDLPPSSACYIQVHDSRQGLYAGDGCSM